MPRFVVLEHDHPDLHWDFMLQWGDVLRTWALARPPGTARRISARPLPDHRTRYLDYEGPISRNRGSVSRWDTGTYQLVRATDNLVVVCLDSLRCAGTCTLAADPEQGDWTFYLEAAESMPPTGEAGSASKPLT